MRFHQVRVCLLGILIQQIVLGRHNRDRLIDVGLGGWWQLGRKHGVR
jgi:hypothetical protein